MPTKNNVCECGCDKSLTITGECPICSISKPTDEEINKFVGGVVIFDHEEKGK